MDTKRLLEISDDLGLSEVSKRIKFLSAKVSGADCPLVLPLVGEFSSGKTTLINALTDSKKLETATQPTTATIYEVHFGADTCRATVLDKDGTLSEYNDIAQLKNERLADAKVVTVYDTSKQVPASVVLVDTPGLSSPDPRHKQTLIEFLPQADGVLLISDINQQLTRSVLDFIDSMEMSKRRIFWILTKSDTKSAAEVEAAKQYIVRNSKVPASNIFTVSALQNRLEQMTTLFSTIQKEKGEILQQVNHMRLSNIAKDLLQKIDELLKASNSSQEIDQAIRQQEFKLNKLQRNIESLIEDVQMDVEQVCREVTRKFEDSISSKLDIIISNRGSNFDAEAVSAINGTTSLFVNELSENLRDLLRQKANQRMGTEGSVELNSLKDVDLSQFEVSGMTYNLNLNGMGHEYDGMIAVGVTALAAAGAAYLGYAAVGGGAAGAAGALDSADTLTDVVCDGGNTVSRLTSGNGNSNGGLVSSLVGYFTDSTLAKPQRRRAINNYLDNELIPKFKSRVNSYSCTVISQIRNALLQEAESTISEMKAVLQTMNGQKQAAKEKFEQRREQLKSYKSEIQNQINA